LNWFSIVVGFAALFVLSALVALLVARILGRIGLEASTPYEMGEGAALPDRPASEQEAKARHHFVEGARL
jgi:hypothetical protein